MKIKWNRKNRNKNKNLVHNIFQICIKTSLISDIIIYAMPRSNKKKKILYQPSVPTGDVAVAQLLRKETTTMISRAIVSIIYI